MYAVVDCSPMNLLFDRRLTGLVHYVTAHLSHSLLNLASLELIRQGGILECKINPSKDTHIHAHENTTHACTAKDYHAASVYT